MPDTWVGISALAIVAALIALAFYFVFKLRRGDQLPNTRRLRVGFFVERDRFLDDDEAVPDDRADTREWPAP